MPSVLIAPGGLSVLTPFGEGACAKLTLDAMAIAVMQAKTSRDNIWALRLERLFDPPRRKLGVVDRKGTMASTVAKLIIGLAKEGERDPNQLCGRAAKILRK